MPVLQKTISREISLDGRGLFSGEPVKLTFAPAGTGAGIMFLREQDEKSATIPALVGNVLKRPRRTCLRNGTLHVETVEHCLAALSGMGINNAVVKISGGAVGEVPMGTDRACRSSARSRKRGSTSSRPRFSRW